MKFFKPSLALALACALALGLCACGPEEEKPQVPRTPFAAVEADPLAYFNAVVPLLRDAEGFVAETSYGLDDIEVGNAALKEAKNLVKNQIKAYINNSFTKEEGGFFVTQPENLFQKKTDPVPADMAERCPALFYALTESDLLDPAAFEALMEGKIAGGLKKLDEDIGKGLVKLLTDENGVSLKDGNGAPVKAADATDAQKRAHVVAHLYETLIPGGMRTPLKANEVLELKVAEKRRKLEEDIEQGLVSSLTDADGKRLKGPDGRVVKAADATDEQKRVHVLNQLGETAVQEAAGLYQLDGELALAAAELLLAPADKADILAQLAKAKEYLIVEDYALEFTEFTLFAQVNKRMLDEDGDARPVDDPAQSQDMLRELRFTLKAKLTATATGAGAFAGAGEIPISLTLTKTVTYKNIKWKVADENA